MTEIPYLRQLDAIQNLLEVTARQTDSPIHEICGATSALVQAHTLRSRAAFIQAVRTHLQSATAATAAADHTTAGFHAAAAGTLGALGMQLWRENPPIQVIRGGVRFVE